MKKLSILLLLSFLSIFANEAIAQTYNSAVGARTGWGLTASYKKFIKESNALEFTLGSYGYSRTLYVSALYQKHKSLAEIDNLFWYIGGGVGASVYTGSTSVGILFNLGLDYSFDEFPLNISLDITPGFWLIGYRGFNARGGGLAARYILNSGDSE